MPGRKMAGYGTECIWEGKGARMQSGKGLLPDGLPAAARRSASAAVTPYVLQLANGRLDDNPALPQGIDIRTGGLAHPVLGL